MYLRKTVNIGKKEVRRKLEKKLKDEREEKKVMGLFYPPNGCNMQAG